MKINLKKILLLSLGLLAVFKSVFADEWKMETNWPASPAPAGAELTPDATIAELVAYIYEWGITIGVLIFFTILIFAGLQYVTSAGSPDKLSKAKKYIISGFAGLTLLLGSFLLLRTINPELTEISTIRPPTMGMAFHEFQSSLDPDDDMCEFAIIETQEGDSTDTDNHFMIPGMSIATDPMTPVESKACTPRKEEDEIFEVRINNDRESYVLVKKTDSSEIKREISFDTATSSNVRDLYKGRYSSRDPISISDDTVAEYLLTLRDRNLYNLFEDCDNITGYPQFNRPRCLELDNNGNLREWRRIGYPSLGDVLKDPPSEDCPDSYKRDSSGGGCSIAFYDGGYRRWWTLWISKVITCENQISRPSADMLHFRGIVDRPSNCMELIRDEPRLNLDNLPKRTITVENKASLDAELTVDSTFSGPDPGSKMSFDRDFYSDFSVSVNYDPSDNYYCLRLYSPANTALCGEASHTNEQETLNCIFPVTENMTIYADGVYGDIDCEI